MSFNEDYYREGFGLVPKNSSNVTDKDYQCSDNYIISGNNVDKIANSTMMDCKNECLNNEDCIGFNFGQDKTCYLKKNVNSFKKSSDCTFCVKKSLAKNKCNIKNSRLRNNNNNAFNELTNIFGEPEKVEEVLSKLSPEHIQTIAESNGRAIPTELQGKITKSEIETIVENRQMLRQVIDEGELSREGAREMVRSRGGRMLQEALAEGDLSREEVRKMISSRGGRMLQEALAEGELSRGEVRNMISSRGGRMLQEALAEGELSHEEIKQIVESKGKLSPELRRQINRKMRAEREDEDDESVEGEDDEDDEDDEDEDESVDGEDEVEMEPMVDVYEENPGLTAENEVKQMLQENNSLNENLQRRRMMRRAMRRRRRKTKIFVNLQCFMKDMQVLQNHSDGIMVELPLLLSHLKSCSFVRKRRGNVALRKRLRNRLKNSGHKLTKAEKAEIRSEIETTMGEKKMKIPKPNIVKLQGDDVETFETDSNYYSDEDEDQNEEFYYENFDQVDDILDELGLNQENKENQQNQKMSSCLVNNYSWSWDFMTILKICLLALLVVLIFNSA